VSAGGTLPYWCYQTLAINRPVKNMNGRKQRGAWLGALVVDRKQLRRWRFLRRGKKKRGRKKSSKVGPFSREWLFRGGKWQFSVGIHSVRSMLSIYAINFGFPSEEVRLSTDFTKRKETNSIRKLICYFLDTERALFLSYTCKVYYLVRL